MSNMYIKNHNLYQQKNTPSWDYETKSDDYMTVHDLSVENISSVWAFLIGLLTGIGLMSALCFMVYKVRFYNTSEDTHTYVSNKHSNKLKSRPTHNIRYNSSNKTKTKTTKCTARRHKWPCSSLRRYR